ncbi:MAG TPA: Ig-like domain-containing protein [Longimicrobium sp.]
MKSIRSLLAACALIPAVATACADRTPVAGEPPSGPSPAPAVAQLRCDVDVRGGTMTCGGPAPAASRGDLLLGGQDFFVKLRSTNVAFSAPTLSADVSLQNLLAQPMGTTDGTTPAPAGVRIFFAAQPATTGGTGSVTVQNADGTDIFTASGQPYFAYPGILAPGATSAAKTWQFHLDPGVTFFTFVVYVSAPLPRENGWVDVVSFSSLAMAPGQSRPLVALVFSGSGAEVEDAPVAWATSDSSVATVDASGRVTAVAAGTATITATSGPRTGSTQVTVAALDVTQPDLTGIDFSPDTAAPGDTVTVSFAASDAGTGVASVTGTILLPRPGSFALRVSCSAFAPSAGTRAAGTFACRVPLPPGADNGPWTFSQVSVVDLRGNFRTFNTAGLSAAGLPTGFTVTNPTPDTVPPALVGETVTPPSANVGDSLTFTVQVSDAGTGVASVQAGIDDPAGRQLTCTATTPVAGTANSGTYTCKIPIPAGSRPGNWQLSGIFMTDRTGNSDIDGGTFVIPVAGPAPDTTAPTLRSIAFSSTVSRVDSLTVTIGTADAGAGVDRVVAEFRAPTYNQRASCARSTLAGGTAAFGVFECRIGFSDVAEAGTWAVEGVVLFDAVGNSREVRTGSLQALGYATTLQVTP